MCPVLDLLALRSTIVIGWLYLALIAMVSLITLGPVFVLISLGILYAAAGLAWAYCAWDQHRA